MPALRTAEETAFTAVWIKFIRAVKSPVACGCFFCSANMNLVNVIGSTSIAGWHGGHDEVLILKRFGLFLRLGGKIDCVVFVRFSP